MFGVTPEPWIGRGSALSVTDPATADDEEPRLGRLSSVMVGVLLALVGIGLGALAIPAFNAPGLWPYAAFLLLLLGAAALTARVLARLRPSMTWALSVALPVTLIASLYYLQYTWPRNSMMCVVYVVVSVLLGLPHTDWTRSLPRGKGRERRGQAHTEQARPADGHQRYPDGERVRRS